jgi:hypothetical protein
MDDLNISITLNGNDKTHPEAINETALSAELERVQKTVADFFAESDDYNKTIMISVQAHKSKRLTPK